MDCHRRAARAGKVGGGGGRMRKPVRAAMAWLMPGLLILCGAGLGAMRPAMAQQHYSFGYDQPRATGFGVAADIFAASLAKSSGGAMVIDQFPGAQLGQEPQALQKIRTGDIDFLITSTANAATLQPQSGVMSLHYLFTSEQHLAHALADPAVVAAMRAMFDETVTGVKMLGLATLGLRDLYGKKEVHGIADLRGLKIRVQATATEDAIFPAYGAQTVHMPFGSVYTSLQTGVVDMAENGVNVYMANKHYETAPVMSMTEHEANNSVLWVSDKVWSACRRSSGAGCRTRPTRCRARSRRAPWRWSTRARRG